MLEVSREVRSGRIACLNWPEAFPAQPEVAFDISHSGDALHLRFRVQEEAVRAVCAADGGRAWEDSCVEFFFAPREDGVYYNLECTCIGRILLCRGTGRHGREPLPEALLQGIRRRATLGTDPFGLRPEPKAWTASPACRPAATSTNAATSCLSRTTSAGLPLRPRNLTFIVRNILML